MCLRVFDDVTEERLALSAGSEDRPCQHIFKCFIYLFISWFNLDVSH